MDAHVLTRNEGEEEEYDTSRTEEIKMVEIAETDIIQPLEQDLEAGLRWEQTISLILEIQKIVPREQAELSRICKRIFKFNGSTYVARVIMTYLMSLLACFRHILWLFLW